MDEDGSKASGTTEYTVDPSQLDNLFDMSAPQQRYHALDRSRAAHRVMDGMVMVTSRAAVDETLQDPKRFSSADVGGIVARQHPPADPAVGRPARATRSTARSSTRCSRRSGWTRSRTTSPRGSNHFIDGFVDRGECHFTDEFAVPFPSAVFLGLMGLPWEELDTFLRHEGRHHPSRRRRARPWRSAMTASNATPVRTSTRYFDEILDERAAGPRGRHPHALPRHAEVDGEQAHPRRDPRHLLPVPHRRARHRHRFAHVLRSRTWRSIPSTGSRSSTTRRSSRPRSRSSCAGRRRCRACRGSAPRTPRSPGAR